MYLFIIKASLIWNLELEHVSKYQSLLRKDFVLEFVILDFVCKIFASYWNESILIIDLVNTTKQGIQFSDHNALYIKFSG